MRSYSKVQMLPYITPGTSIVCLGIAAALETDAFAELPGKAGVLALPTVMIALSVATLTVCELRIVHISAATVMVILSVVHNIPIILGGVLWNHDHVYRNQLLGFALCTFGAALYFVARLQDDERKNPQLEERLHDGNADQQFAPL
mmetsp:Transcript_2017/g.6309  ORF Transcript_2017/g.6309 Transcript_2017/m.6309 type:complete len:146 (-) Transcript_2017:30-467(-)